MKTGENSTRKLKSYKCFWTCMQITIFHYNVLFENYCHSIIRYHIVMQMQQKADRISLQKLMTCNFRILHSFSCLLSILLLSLWLSRVLYSLLSYGRAQTMKFGLSINRSHWNPTTLGKHNKYRNCYWTPNCCNSKSLQASYWRQFIIYFHISIRGEGGRGRKPWLHEWSTSGHTNYSSAGNSCH